MANPEELKLTPPDVLIAQQTGAIPGQLPVDLVSDPSPPAPAAGPAARPTIADLGSSLPTFVPGARTPDYFGIFGPPTMVPAAPKPVPPPPPAQPLSLAEAEAQRRDYLAGAKSYAPPATTADAIAQADEKQADHLGGGMGGPPAPQTDPWLDAGAQIGDLKTPGEYASELHAAIMRGDMSPAEAAKRSQAYRDRYNSTEGGALRLQSSQIAQEREKGAAGIQQQERDIQAAQAVADLKARAAKEAHDIDAERQAGLQAFNDAQRQQQAQVAIAQQKADDFKLDPAKLWSSDSGRFAGVMSALSLMIGGVAQGVSRGTVQNPGLKAVDAIIARELDGQKFQAAQLRQGVASQQNLLAMARQHFSDEDTAHAFAKQTMYEHVAAQADQIASNADNDRMRAAAELAASLFRQRASDQQLAFETGQKAQLDLAARQAAQAYAAASAAQQGKQSVQDIATLRGEPTLIPREELEKNLGTGAAAYIPAGLKNGIQYGYYASDPETGKAVASQVATAKTLLQQVAFLYDKANTEGSSWTGADRRAAEFVKINLLKSLAAESGGAGGQGGGRGTKLLEMFEDVVPSGTDREITDPERDKAKKTLALIHEVVSDEASNAMRNVGMTPVYTVHQGNRVLRGVDPEIEQPSTQLVHIGKNDKDQQFLLKSGRYPEQDTREVKSTALNLPKLPEPGAKKKTK